jgi:type VI secretion system secreted protein VgrG
MVSVPGLTGSVLGSPSAGAPFEMNVGDVPTGTLRVASFEGSEEMSKLYAFDVLVVPPPGVDGLEGTLLGRPATLHLQPWTGASRMVRGVVAGAEATGAPTKLGEHPYRLRIVPRLSLLKNRRSSRIFQDKTVPEVVASLLELARVPLRVSLQGAYPRREYCVQYRETDYAFVRRILSEEGIYWYFDHGTALEGTEAPETLVLIDDPSAYPPAMALPDPRHLDPGGPLVVREVAGGTAVDTALSFSPARRLAPDAVMLRDYDFERPLLELRTEAWWDATSDSIRAADTASGTTAKAPETGANAAGANVAILDRGSFAATSVGLSQQYAHRGDYLEMDLTPERAKAELERRRVRARDAVGESNAPLLTPGYRFTLETDAARGGSQELVATRVTHVGHSPHFGEGAPTRTSIYRNTFACVASSVPVRPKRRERRRTAGLESAVVVGPSGEEIHTDGLGRIKIQFAWDLDGRGDDTSSCWIRVMQVWGGTSWGTQFIPRVGMEALVSFLGGDHDCPVVVGTSYNSSHPPSFPLPAAKTRSGIRTQTTPGGGGGNELSFEDARGQEQLYVHAQRDMDQVVERNLDLLVRGSETRKVEGGAQSTVAGDSSETVRGHAVRTLGKDETVRVDGNRLEVVGGDHDLRVEGAARARVGRQKLDVTGISELAYGADHTVRATGCFTTIVGKNDRKRSYVLRVEGTSQLSSSGVTEIDAEKGLTLRCGKSFIKITDDKIELVAPSVSAKGEGGGIVADDKLTLRAKEDILIASKKILLKTPDASVSLKKDVEVAGQKILLNSPDKADDPVVDTSPPPTKIALKDSTGRPLAYQRFLVKLEDGSEVSGILDAEGKTEMVVEGGGQITFPELSKAGPG